MIQKCSAGADATPNDPPTAITNEHFSNMKTEEVPFPTPTFIARFPLHDPDILILSGQTSNFQLLKMKYERIDKEKLIHDIQDFFVSIAKKLEELRK